MRKTKRTRTQWHELVRAWRKSQLSAGKFAAKQDLDPRQLRWWAWRLGREEAAPHVALRFVEIPPQPEPERSPAMLELGWPDGRVLRFPSHVDPVALRAVVTAIEERR